MSYKQLIEGQRYQIQAYLYERLSYREIGRRLKISHSSISREIRRHSINGRYDPDIAKRRAQYRRKYSAKTKVSQKTIDYVEFGLSLKWSPEQIAGVGQFIGLPISHEWVYGHVERDKCRGGKLYKHLRHNGRRYKKGDRAKRVIIPNRIGIENRPHIVDSKERFGDWEVYTVLGKQGTGAIVSLVERKSKIYLIRKVPSKSTEDVCRAIGTMLWRYRRHVHTITADNGTEFCAHESVARKLKTDVYFANPYASLERDSNENFNGLLRQYIPKGTDLRMLSDEEIARVERSLNLRPRRCLGYKQPAVVFDELRRAA